jgi:hypothetical protein
MTGRKPIPRQTAKIIQAATEIQQDAPSDQDKAFLARQLVQTTLPHADPGNVPVWSRTNGNITLLIQQGYKANGEGVGHPYGTIPRLLMYWMTTEAVRTKSPRLVLGDSLAAFMEELGLDSRGGGARSDRARLEQQMRRLFAARISFEGTIQEEDMGAEVVEYMPIARRTVFWWNQKDPGQKTLWESYVELDSEFFRAITANPVPVDLRALRAIKRSPLALDLYSLLTYQAFRSSKSGRPVFMTWRQMQNALGTSYADHTDLKKAVKLALNKIAVVYPGLAVGSREGGVEVLPESVPAIASL